MVKRHSINPVPQLPKSARSRVSNGHQFLVPSGRSAEGRRLRDLGMAFESEFPIAELTEPRRQLIRRLAAVSLIAESLEADLAAGKVVDPTEYAKISGQCSRLMQRLGLSTKVQPAREPQTLEAHLAGIGYGTSPDDDEAEDGDDDD